MNTQISTLLVGICRLYMEFAHCSTSLRDYAYYMYLYERTNDHITQLHKVAEAHGDFTPEENRKIIDHAMRDFALSFREGA